MVIIFQVEYFNANERELPIILEKRRFEITAGS